MFKNKKRYYYALFGLFLGTIFLWQEVAKFSSHNLRVYFFDVGQGDGAYIRTPENQDILIDGGPSSAILTRLGEKMPFFDRKIELIILSHPQADHLSGIVDVLNRYQVDKIIWTKATCETGACQEFREKIAAKNVAEEKAVVGDKINFGSINIKFLYPFADMEGKKLKDLNYSTIVAQIFYSNNSFLFTGDISQDIEKQLLNTKIVQRADVLKVAHHGSKYSSSPVFLKSIQPEYAIISIGENSYGHPASQTLQNLESAGAKIFRTDQDGDIECESTGEKINCQKE